MISLVLLCEIFSFHYFYGIYISFLWHLHIIYNNHTMYDDIFAKSNFQVWPKILKLSGDKTEFNEFSFDNIYNAIFTFSAILFFIWYAIWFLSNWYWRLYTVLGINNSCFAFIREFKISCFTKSLYDLDWFFYFKDQKY